jgi:Domain of unknown function (DUF4398)
MTSWKYRRLTAPAIIASVLALAACAEPQPPTAALRSAGMAIARAEQNGAQSVAPQPLQMAQDKLNRAHGAVNAKEMTTAERLAEESEADANLANATSNAVRLNATAAELQGLEQQQRR